MSIKSGTNITVAALATVTAVAVCTGAYYYLTQIKAGRATAPTTHKHNAVNDVEINGANSSKASTKNKRKRRKSSKPKQERKPLDSIGLGKEQGELGAKKFKNGDMSGARACYLQALNFFPEGMNEERKTVYHNLAAVEEKMGKHREVIESCSQALRIDPISTKALARRARAYEKLGDKPKAAGDYALILLIDSNEQNTKLNPVAYKSITSSLEKITNAIGETEALALLEEKQKTKGRGLQDMPSAQFVVSYLFSFSAEPPLFNREESIREETYNFASTQAKEILMRLTGVTATDQVLPLYSAVVSQVTNEDSDLREFAKNQLDRAVALKYLRKFHECGVLVEDLVSVEGMRDVLGNADWARCCDLLGTLYLVCSDNKLAEEFLTKCVEANPANIQALLRLAAVRLELGDLEKSNECYDSVTSLVEEGLKNETVSPFDVADYHFHVAQRGMVSATPDLEAAETHMKAAVEAVPSFVFARMQLGIAQFQGSKHEEAVEALQKCCELAPELSQTHTYLGEVLCTLGRLEEAEKKFDDAISVDPNAANAYVNKGVMLTAENPTPEKNKEALHLYQTAIDRDPKSEIAFVRIGLLYFNMGIYQLALKNFNSAIDLATGLADLVMFCTQRAHCLARLRAVSTYQANVARSAGFRLPKNLRQ